MPNSLIPDEQIYREVRKAIAETLRASEESIQPERSLIGELDAESLDFIDINYRLEQRFHISMPRKYLLEHVEEFFGEGTAINENGEITETAVSILKARLGAAGQHLTAGMSVDDVPTLVTPQTLVEIVREILISCPEKCATCGATWKVVDGCVIACSSCGKPPTFASGDDLVKKWLKEFKEGVKREE